MFSFNFFLSFTYYMSLPDVVLVRSCGQSGCKDLPWHEVASSHLGCRGGGEAVMRLGQLKVTSLIQDEMTKAPRWASELSTISRTGTSGLV